MDSSYNIQNYFKRGRTVILTLRQGLEEGGGNAQGRQWTDKETTLLMSLMDEFRQEFKSQKRRKKEVWNDVTKRMHQSNYMWTPEDCRKKWSNMVRTFKTIEEQRRHPEHPLKKVKWPFHEEMTKLLSTDGADSLPEAATVCSYMREFPVPGEGHDHDTDDEVQEISDPLLDDGVQDQEQVQVDHDQVHDDVIIPELEISDVAGSSHGQSNSDGHGAHPQNGQDPTGILSSSTAGQAVPVDTESMQYFLIDNQDGDTRQNGNVVDVTAASVDTAVSAALDGQDFDTLATVAAAAASASSSHTHTNIEPEPGNFPIPLRMTTFDLKPFGKNFMSQVDTPISNQNEHPAFDMPTISNQNNISIPVDPNSSSQILTSEQESQIPATDPIIDVPVSGVVHPIKIDQQLPVPLLDHSISLPNISQSETITNQNPAAIQLSPPIQISAPRIGAHRASANLLKRKASFNLRKDKDVKKKRGARVDEDGQGSATGSGGETGDPLVDKFIAISNKQNERILERMEKFHEESLSVMRERNKLLENMVTFLKQQFVGSNQMTVTATGSPVTGTPTAAGLNMSSQIHNSSTFISVPAAIPSITPGQSIPIGSPAKTTSIRVYNPSIALSRAAVAVSGVSGSSVIPTISIKKS